MAIYPSTMLYPLATLYAEDSAPWDAQHEYVVEIDFSDLTGSSAVYMGPGGTATTYSGSSTTYTPAQAYASSATATFSGDYDDVTADTTDVEIQRGRDDVGGPMRPGIAKITVQRVTNDPNVTGAGGRELYNPASTTSPLSPYYEGISPAKVDPGIVPLRPLRITMRQGIYSRVRFFGYITSWRYNRENGAAEITARDVLWKLSKVLPTTTQSVGETTASAIGKLLDEAGWTAPDDRALNPNVQGANAGNGRTLPASTFVYDGTEKSGFSIVDDLLTASRGAVFCAGAVFVHEDYPARSLRKSPDVTLTDVALEYDPGFEVE